jgi:hypothetical protein
MRKIVTILAVSILAVIGVIGAVALTDRTGVAHPVVVMPNGVKMPHHLMTPTGTGRTMP